MTGWPTPNFRSCQAAAALIQLARFEPADLFYSLGTHNPGAVRLHNYPKFMQNLLQDNGDRFDLGAVDILRDRERGVPRYNRSAGCSTSSPSRASRS